jgi:hypothetical protein
MGLRRRRWVLIAFLGLTLSAGFLAMGLRFGIVPSVQDDAWEARNELQSTNLLVEATTDRTNALFVWVLSGGDERARAELDDAAGRVDSLTTSLTGAFDADARAALAEVAAADASIDELTAELAAELAAGREVGAADLASSSGAAATGELADAVSHLRTQVTDASLRASNRAADAVRWVSVLLVVPVAPSAWVAFQLMKGLREMRQLNQRMVDASTEVSASAAQLSAASEELAATSVEGAAAFAEALATIEELARSADAIAESVDGVAAQSQDMRANLEQAGADIEESSQRMLQLADRVDEVGVILGLINEIADQTNLLALNAAIEAARAGENGRGFAVVADEVRRLAERSKSSSAKIATLIESAQGETSATVMAMEKGAKQMRRAMVFMDTVTEASSNGRLSAEQQRTATQQVVITMDQLSGTTKSVSATTHQIAASAVGLAELAKGLETTAARSAAGV